LYFNAAEQRDVSVVADDCCKIEITLIDPSSPILNECKPVNDSNLVRPLVVS